MVYQTRAKYNKPGFQRTKGSLNLNKEKLAELERRMKEAFANDKSHVKRLSEND